MNFKFTPQTGRIIDMLKRWKFAEVKTTTFVLTVRDGMTTDERGDVKSIRMIASVLINGRKDMPPRPFLQDYLNNCNEWRKIMVAHIVKRIVRNTNRLPKLEISLSNVDAVCFAIEQSFRTWLRTQYDSIGAPWSASYRAKIMAMNERALKSLRMDGMSESDKVKARRQYMINLSPSLLSFTGRLANSVVVIADDSDHWSVKTGETMKGGRRRSSSSSAATTLANTADATVIGG